MPSLRSGEQRQASPGATRLKSSFPAPRAARRRVDPGPAHAFEHAAKSMGKPRTRAKTRHNPPRRNAGRAGQVGRQWHFWLACAAFYLYAGAVLWPSIGFGPIELDDATLLKQFSEQPLSRVLSHDAFGHWRPVKNLLFWLLAGDLDRVAPVRITVLAFVLASAALVQGLATTLLHSRAWGLTVAMCWALNPTTPSVVCWLSATNHALCLGGMLVYGLLAQLALELVGRPFYVRAIASVGAIAALLLALSSHQLAVFAPLLWVAYRRTLGLTTLGRPYAVATLVASGLCLVGLVVGHLLGEPRRPTTDSPSIQSGN